MKKLIKKSRTVTVKGIIFVVFALCSMLYGTKVFSQGNLQLNAALIIDSTLHTVPSGTMWKIEAIYGERRNFCIFPGCGSWASSSYVLATVAGMYVNGTLITSSIRGLTTTNTVYSDNLCTMAFNTGDKSCGNRTSDPNILPIWIPA